MTYIEKSVSISNIRQYTFCPRIFWYKEVLMLTPPEQPWMKVGKDWHDKQQLMQKRRVTKYIKDKEVKRLFSVPVRSKKYKIHGILDEVIITTNNAVIIEYKDDLRKPFKSQIMQLFAYSVAFSEERGIKTDFGVLLKGLPKNQFKIDFTKDLENRFIKTINNLQKDLASDLLPNTSASLTKCAQCEYLRICNDR